MAVPRHPQRPPRVGLLEAVCTMPAYYALLGGILLGVILIGASIVLQNATWTAKAPTFANIDRQVGYMAALNWSVTFLLLFPVILYLMANTIQGLFNALNRLHARGMVRSQNMKVVKEPLLTARWIRGAPTRAWLLIILAGVIPLGLSLGEWFTNNFLRLMHESSDQLSQTDYDWGLAGLMQADASFTYRLANALFDLLTFSSQALLIGSLMTFFVVALDLGRVIPSGRPGDRYVLIPDLKSKDHRLGFQEFTNPLEQLLAVALVAYLICYLVRLENAYMASTGSSSIGDFVTSDILAGVTAAAQELSLAEFSDALVRLFSLYDIQVRGALAWLSSVLIAVFSLATVVINIRGAALCAKNNAIKWLEDNSLQPPDGDRAAARQKLDAMVIWPLGYLQLNKLMFWVSIAVTTLLLYRIGLFMAGIVAVSIFFRLAKQEVEIDRDVAGS